MRITVHVTPNARKVQVTKRSADEYSVLVDAPAKDNKANIRLISILADYFNVPKSTIGYVSGIRSRTKTLTILD